MLLELGTGRTRPMRQTQPLFSCADMGVLVEEHPASAWQSRNVMLMNSVVYVTLRGGGLLEWHGEGKSVFKGLAPGQVSILPANHPYSAKLRSDGGSIMISLEQKLLACAAAELGELTEVELLWVHCEQDALVRELSLELRDEMSQTGAGNVNYARTLVSTLATHVVRRYSQQRPLDEKRPKGLTTQTLRRAVQFIHDHLAEDISLERLATEVSLSTCHFARMFKQSTGLSPHEYILRCRLARAKQMLFNKSVSIAQVAMLTGFCDQGHLTRSFRKHLGITPAVFARSVRLN